MNSLMESRAREKCFELGRRFIPGSLSAGEIGRRNGKRLYDVRYTEEDGYGHRRRKGFVANENGEVEYA